MSDFLVSMKHPVCNDPRPSLCFVANDIHNIPETELLQCMIRFMICPDDSTESHISCAWQCVCWLIHMQPSIIQKCMYAPSTTLVLYKDISQQKKMDKNIYWLGNMQRLNERKIWCTPVISSFRLICLLNIDDRLLLMRRVLVGNPCMCIHACVSCTKDRSKYIRVAKKTSSNTSCTLEHLDVLPRPRAGSWQKHFCEVRVSQNCILYRISNRNFQQILLENRKTTQKVKSSIKYTLMELRLGSCFFDLRIPSKKVQ